MEKPKLIISHFPNGNWVVTGKKGAFLTSSCDDQAVTIFKNFNEISAADLEAMHHNNFHLATEKIFQPGEVEAVAVVKTVALPKNKVLLQKLKMLFIEMGPAFLFVTCLFTLPTFNGWIVFFGIAITLFVWPHFFQKLKKNNLGELVWPNLFDFLRKRKTA